MTFRIYTENDLERIVEIWLEGSKLAHHFIDADYWKSKQIEMKEVYLPMSQSYVIEEEGNLVGFISLVDNYLAALFVDPKEQGIGYGKQLLDNIKEQKESLDLRVYQENKNAVRFYLKNDFNISAESIDEHTSAKEYAMTWRKE